MTDKSDVAQAPDPATIEAERDVISHCQQIADCAGQVERQTVRFLVDCLGDPDPLVRWEAGIALAETAHVLSKPQGLKHMLGREKEDATTFGELLSWMRQGLASQEPDHRAAVVAALSHWPHQTALELLAQSLADETPMVRATAARGLGQLGAVDMVDALIDALADDSLWVRRAAADALGAIDDTRAAEPLAIMAPEGPVLARTAAIMALGHLPCKESRRILVVCLTDSDGEIRWHAARALQSVGTVEALPALENLSGDDFCLFDRPVHEIAQSTIQAIGQREKGPWHALRLVFFQLRGWIRRIK